MQNICCYWVSSSMDYLWIEKTSVTSNEKSFPTHYEQKMWKNQWNPCLKEISRTEHVAMFTKHRRVANQMVPIMSRDPNSPAASTFSRTYSLQNRPSSANQKHILIKYHPRCLLKHLISSLHPSLIHISWLDDIFWTIFEGGKCYRSTLGHVEIHYRGTKNGHGNRSITTKFFEIIHE